MLQRPLREERGQALTEFAIVLPILVGVIVVVVESGIALSHYVRLTDAVRAGARAASITHTVGAAQSAAISASGGLLQPSDVQVPTTDWTPGQDVTVTAHAPYSISFLGITIVSGQLTSTTVQRIE